MILKYFFSECLLKHHALNLYGKEDVQLHTFLKFTIGGVSSHIHAPAALNSAKRPPLPTEYEYVRASERVSNPYKR